MVAGSSESDRSSVSPYDKPSQRPVPARVCAFLLTAIAAGYALSVPQMLGWALFTEQYLALLFALTLFLVFTTMPARQGAARRTVPWWDWGLGLLGFAAAGYVALGYPRLVDELVYKPLDGLVISAILVILSFEAVRRAAGLGLTIIIGAFLLYGGFGDLLPGALSASPVQLDRLFIYLAMDTNSLLGMPLLVAGEIVIAFILMGYVLQASGGSDFFVDLALALVGRRRGGAGKISVVASFLFGSVSGSAVANVASSGVVTIPLMRRFGHPRHHAAAIEAVASTGGQLAPPVMGAAAFLMAEFLSISYASVLVAAIVPTLLYYLSVFVWVDLTAGRQGLVAPRDLEVPSLWEVSRTGWHFPLPFVVLVTGLFAFNLPPELAVMIATGVLALTSFAIGYRGRRLTVGRLLRAIEGTGYAALEVMVICAAAGLVIGVLNLSGLAFALTLQLTALAGGSLLPLLLIAAGVSIVLGMGMPTVGVYVLLAGLIGPAMVLAGADPVGGHLFLLYFGMLSMITPPVALASFTAASIAGANFWKTGWQAARVAWVAYFIPFLWIYEPALILQTSWDASLWHTLGAIVGVVFATMALVGFAARPLGAMERLLLGLAAAISVLPLEVFTDSGVVPNAAAAAVGGAVYLRARLTRTGVETAAAA